MRRFLRVIGYLALGFVLLLVAGYAVHGLVGTFQVRDAKHRAVDELVEALPSARASVARQREQVHTAFPELADPTYSWEELRCELETIDAGWIVQDYVQRCTLHSIDLLATDAAGTEDCVDLGVPASVEADRVGGVRIRRGPTAAFTHEPSWERSCPLYLTAPSPLGTTRVLRGERPSTLRSSPGWEVAEVETDVSDTILGCDPWAVLFCTEPVDGPLLGDAGR